MKKWKKQKQKNETQNFHVNELGKEIYSRNTLLFL